MYSAEKDLMHACYAALGGSPGRARVAAAFGRRVAQEAVAGVVRSPRSGALVVLDYGLNPYTWVRIPIESDHPFRSNPITHSGVFDHPAEEVRGLAPA